ncbi:hypothetical protein [Desulfobacter sp.]
MHFEILVEDQSGKKALEIIVPKIVNVSPSFVHFREKLDVLARKLKHNV